MDVVAGGLAGASACGVDHPRGDERDRPGEKFADAELLGCPLRLTVGRRSLESGEIEVQERRARTAGPPLELASEPAQLLRAVDELWQSLP